MVFDQYDLEKIDNLRKNIQGIENTLKKSKSRIIKQSIYLTAYDSFITNILNYECAQRNNGKLEDKVYIYTMEGKDDSKFPIRVVVKVSDFTFQEFGKRYKSRLIGKGFFNTTKIRKSCLDVLCSKCDAPTISQIIIPCVEDFFIKGGFNVEIKDYDLLGKSFHNKYK